MTPLILLGMRQVASLVLTNIAAVPGAIIAYQCKFPVLAIVLVTAGVSSGTYHLCDSDATCLGGWMTFQSLQVRTSFHLFINEREVLCESSHFKAVPR